MADCEMRRPSTRAVNVCQQVPCVSKESALPVSRDVDFGLGGTACVGLETAC